MNELTGQFSELRRALEFMEEELRLDSIPEHRLMDLKTAVDNVRGSLLAILSGARTQRLPAQIAEFRLQRATQLTANIRSDVRLGLLPPGSPSRAELTGTVIELLDHIRAAQHRRIQAQKLETVGTLAGGIAHDFNNILTPIHGYLSMALEDTPDDSPTFQDLLEAKRAVQRAEHLVRQILTFSRQGESEKECAPIHRPVLEAVTLLRASVPTSILLDVHIRDDCGAVQADPTQIHQVVMNLVTNAYHAMEDRGGAITVRLEPVESAPAGRTAEVAGPCVRLEVTDDGAGMTEETASRLFEPFFTTKAAGRGTGLGLAVVHGIVTDHGGCIAVDSRLGEGSTFSVYLPRAAAAEGTVSEAEPDIVGGQGRVMLVEDDDHVLKMLTKQLERLGYSVAASPDSTESLDMIRTDPDSYDLIITDYMMPGMTGDVLAAAIHSLRPELPVILISGNLGQLDGQDAESLGFSACLAKPLNVGTLSRTIRASIRRDPPRKASA